MDFPCPGWHHCLKAKGAIALLQPILFDQMRADGEGNLAVEYG